MKKLLKHRNSRIAIGVVAVIALWGVFAPKKESDAVTEDAPRAAVRRGDLVVSILQSGELQAKNSREISNEASHNAKIVEIVNDGAFVTNGQLLVELESSELEDRYLQQKSSVASAEADLLHTQEALAIDRLKHGTDQESAKLKVELAELDLKKYKEAEYPQMVLKAQSDITLAEQELKTARGELEGTQELFDKDFASRLELESAQLKVDRQEIEVRNKTKDLEILKEYTYLKTLKELENNVRIAHSDLERLEKSFEAEVTRSEANIEAKKTSLEIQRNQLENRENELVNTKVYADFDGQVFYPVTERWRRQQQIEKGATLDYRQQILSFPDLSAWNLKVGIPEAMIDKVTDGQEAVATVDALPGLILRGRVSKVTAVPDNQGWFSTGVKTYTVMIEVTSGANPKLKPGMTVKVEILTDELKDVLYVPIQSVVSKNDQHYVYVIKRGRKELREVEIGKYNNLYMEVRDGLEEGEEILLYAEVEADKDAMLRKSPLDQEEENASEGKQATE
ncbi:MAG: efflux RND transporter periplasmic adaptor subunit [Pontiellaceae bacterium]|nr:efflux RND transporter periplasmic adaptor subunit [Pontiellaceae bacterium]MBN2786460.1 efflux RND transporter periplasmic adaptor subunit [Pontiellaceae bacterium]